MSQNSPLYTTHTKADVIALTETWFTSDDAAAKVECTPPGYVLLDHPRVGRAGGGTALLCRDNIRFSKEAAGEMSSFEFSEWIVTTADFRLRLAIIYRPPYSAAHPVTTGVFFTEFADYLESIILSSEPLLITGDFNIHVDIADDCDSMKLIELLVSLALRQHVDTPTHLHGHTLDLIITRNSDSFISSPPTSDYYFSAVFCSLKSAKPPLSAKEVSYRKLKSINIQASRMISRRLISVKICH